MEILSVRGAVMKFLILHMYILGLQCVECRGRMSLEQSPRIYSSHERGSSDRLIASKTIYKSDIHVAPPYEIGDVLRSDSGVDVKALLAFKQALNESSRLTLSSWNATALSPCKWKGITCSHESGRVIAIELAGMGLGGKISPMIGRIQGLQKLDLSDNFLTGKIPGSVGNLTQLANLALRNNTITGPLPPQIGQLVQLQVLNLSENFYLDGPIPESLGNCSSLKFVGLTLTILHGALPQSLGKLSQLEILDLGSTLNNGPVPASLGNCSSLMQLGLGNLYLNKYSDVPTPPNQFSLSNSQLTGTLPDDLRNLKLLTVLQIGGTKIEGNFPSWIANCTSMQRISLTYNRFSGTIPEYLGSLPLTHLGLYGNLFSGQIPSVIGNCSNLEYLYMGYLLVQGVIPPELGFLTKLVTLGMVDVNLEGKIPSTLSNCSALEYLGILFNPNMDTQALPPWIGSLKNLWYVSFNEIQLRGHIPASVGQLSQLYFFDVSSNQLSGSIEKSLANCSNLRGLYLNDNMLGGEIPMELWSLQSIETLIVSNNNLSGSLSDGIANMSNLGIFMGHQNNFGGIFPSRITELPNLGILDLGTNNFYGNIPTAFGNLSALLQVAFDDNSLDGSIPASIGNLSSLEYLALSFNRLTGPLPAELMRCTKLYLVHLEVNALDGNIPVEIGELILVHELVLSSNHLAGKLPWTLGLCANLALLDVSHNRFYGELPSDIFVNASLTLSTLNLSHNSFSGAIPGTFMEGSAIAQIQLSANNFSGSIPASLGELQSLRTLDLSRNSINGTIPKALGNLQNLTLLNVSYNQLEGPLPDTGIFASHNFSAAWFLGNPELCGSRLPKHCPALVAASPCRGLHCHSGALAAIISCSAAFGLLIVGGGIYLASRQWRAHVRNKMLDVENRILMFAADVHLSGQDLVKTIDDPTKLIARGTSSSVYRADLEGGPIAIKIVNTCRLSGDRIDERLEEATSQMQREARTLAGLRHRNILKVLGIFSTSKLTSLMMEYMPLGSLHYQLHNTRPSILSWERRLEIALGVAQGLVYLHEEVEVPIIHRDLKPQNILLDADMTPKLGDFGISTFSKVGDPDKTVTASQWCGTIGYIPPEYARDTKVSTRGDVYTFGIVLLELLTARDPTTEADDLDQNGDLQSGGPSSRGDESNVHSPLVDWVHKRCSGQSLSAAAVVDQSLLGPDRSLTRKEEHQMKMVIQVGLLCTQDNPRSRPRMHDVLAMLTYIQRLGEDLANFPSIYDLAQEEGTDFAGVSE